MSQKVIQFPGTGARTAAANHSGIVLRIGPRRFRLDIACPATGRGEPEDEVAPPRCRGIPVGDGNYTGCAYGDGGLAPLTGPCDCPVCQGSGIEGGVWATRPQSNTRNPPRPLIIPIR